MFNEYKDEMRIRSRILGENISYLTRGYQRQDTTLGFLEDLLRLLQKDHFLVLNEYFIAKTERIVNILTFRFSDREEIRKIRQEIARELAKARYLWKNKREELIQQMIVEERRARRIPEEFPLTEIELVEMYKYDFDCYLAMCHQDIDMYNIPVFYFLATINRICTDHIEYAKINRVIIFFQMFKMEHNHPTALEEYIRITEEHLYPEKQKAKEKKIVPFPKK